MSTGRGVTLMSDPCLVVRIASGVVIRGLLAAIVASMAMAGPAIASPPGAVISNQASLNYLNLAGQPATLLSNQVDVTVAVPRSASSVEFTRVLIAGTGA